MKNRQFRVLLLAILLQPIIMYFWRGYRVKDIAYNQADRQQVSEIHDMVWSMKNS